MRKRHGGDICRCANVRIAAIYLVQTTVNSVMALVSMIRDWTVCGVKAQVKTTFIANSAVVKL